MKFKVRVAFGLFVIFVVYMSFRVMVQELPDEPRYDVYDVNPPDIKKDAQKFNPQQPQEVPEDVAKKFAELEQKYAEDTAAKKNNLSLKSVSSISWYETGLSLIKSRFLIAVLRTR